jgi:hypothetical protein
MLAQIGASRQEAAHIVEETFARLPIAKSGAIYADNRTLVWHPPVPRHQINGDEYPPTETGQMQEPLI